MASIGSAIGAGGGNYTVNTGRVYISLKPKEQRDASADDLGIVELATHPVVMAEPHLRFLGDVGEQRNARLFRFRRPRFLRAASAKRRHNDRSDEPSEQMQRDGRFG